MTRSRRCLAALVDAIKTDVAELTHDGNALCVALWQEADADAGYVIHRDGRMLGVGGTSTGSTTWTS